MFEILRILENTSPTTSQRRSRAHWGLQRVQRSQLLLNTHDDGRRCHHDDVMAMKVCHCVWWKFIFCLWQNETSLSIHEFSWAH
jgi:hypothetical protein